MEINETRPEFEDFTKICRACLGTNTELESIYVVLVQNETKTETVDLVKIFKRHCDVEIEPSDEKPQNVCKICIRQFCEAFAFFDKCFRSNQLLDNALAAQNDLVSNKTQNDEYFSNTDSVEEDSDWEPKQANKLSIKVENDDKSSSDSDEMELKTEPTNRRRILTRRTRRSHRIESEEEDLTNQMLICRLCNEHLSNINSSIEHYDEIHAPKLTVDECILCPQTKTYKKRDNLLYHMGLHSKDSVKCVPCRKYFTDQESLEEHLKICFKTDLKLEENLPTLQLSQKALKDTQVDGAFTCQICQETLGEIDNVIEHFESNHLTDLSCIICLRSFTKQVPLFHLGLHSSNSNICRPCRLFFRNKQEFDDHRLKYDHDNSLNCKICGKNFTRNYKKNKHMLSHLKEKNYSCNKCGKTFTYKTSLARHFKMHFGKRFLCSSCGNAYTTKFMLQRHIKIMHTLVDADGNPLPKPPPKPVKLQCEFCGEIFTSKYGYGRHIRRHPEFKEFKCKICSFMCDTRDQLDTHMENKHNKHTCDVCGKRFPFESELKTHHRKHEDIAMARFRCELCGKTARTQTQLKVHYRIHTGERPFSCDTCGKSFKQSAHLKVHMFQHTGRMPFKCKLCEKSFPFQHVLDIHLRTHTGEKPFQCMYCGNAYHDRTTMQKHQKKKHREMPLQKANRGDYKISSLS